MAFRLRMFDEIKSWFQLAEIGQSRSSITNPLQWMVVILLGGVILGTVIHLPPWLIESLVVLLILVLAVFLYSYLFFMHTKPDVLRSEHFHLSKMRIERGLVGDSLTGLTKAEDLTGSSHTLEGGKLLGSEKDS
jgi:hypothetical protein